MATSQALEVKEKKEVVSKEEKTVPARYFLPTTDIYETDAALTVVMELPGVEKKDIEVSLESDVLRVEARIDFSKYEGLEPLYTEYNVGHFARAFTLSRRIDQQESRGRGRCADVDATQGERGAAASDRDQLTPCGGRSMQLDPRSLILVVDDDAEARDVVARILADDGHAVTTAATSFECLNLLERPSI